MGISPGDFDGFPAGSFTSPDAGGGIFDQSVAHWNAANLLGFNGYGWRGSPGILQPFRSRSIIPGSVDDWVTVGCYVYLDDAAGTGMGSADVRTSAGAAFFRCAFDGGARTLRLKDANGTTQTTINNIDNTEKGQRFVCKFQPKDAGGLYLWYNPWDEPVKLVYSTASGDWRPGTSTQMNLEFGSGSVSDKPMFQTDPFIVYDDGANWDTYDTTFGLHRMEMGNWTCRHYNSNLVSLVSDFGTDLKGPIEYDKSEQKPMADQTVPNLVRMEWPSGTSPVSGGHFKDGGATSAEGGPAGDVPSNSQILMGKWVHGFRREVDGALYGTFGQVIGNSGSQKVLASQTTSTTWAKSQTIEGFTSADAAYVPSTSQDLAIGIAVYKASGRDALATVIRVGDMYAQVLVAEPPPRYVNQKGRIMWGTDL